MAFIKSVGNFLLMKVYQHDIVDDRIRGWEWEWVNASEPYPDVPVGNAIEISKEMYTKYVDRLRDTYKVFSN